MHIQFQNDQEFPNQIINFSGVEDTFFFFRYSNRVHEAPYAQTITFQSYKFYTQMSACLTMTLQF